MKRKITLIDGNSLMFRAFYATAYTGNIMRNKDGLYTNALYGFCNMVNELYKDSEYMFVAFDAGKQTFRHQEYQDYKATRKALPEELRVQIPYIKKYVDILKIAREENLEYEADDLIASVANQAYHDFDEIHIISGDKDLLQLVNDKVTVFLTRRGVGELEEYNIGNFYEKMNINPSQVADYKGLVGDSADNLPGIKGIGEKTAIKLLTEYQTLDNIINNLDDLKGKIKETINDNKKVGLSCKRLATLKMDIDLDYSVDRFRVDEYDLDELVAFFQELEFNSFLKKLNKRIITKTNHDLRIITDYKTDLQDILNADAYLNIEVFGKNYYNGEFLGISFVNEEHQLFLSKDVVLNNLDLQAYLKNEKYCKKTFDYKMLYLVLKKNKINITNITFDLMLAAYLINPAFGSSDFKQTVDHFGSYNIAFYDNIYGANKKMKIPAIEVYAKYSVDKGLILQQLESEILAELTKLDLDYLYQIELELSTVLADMEYHGLLINVNRLDEIGEDLAQKLNMVAEDIYFIAGEEFNINSPKKLGEILFEKLHLPHGKRNKTGFSTNVDVLEKLALDFKIAKLVLEYRGLNKLITTYVNGLKEVVDCNSYIHPLYKQAETLTGRLSSVEPNIQNMPIRTEEGQVIREIFISRFPNGKILSADYSQIELRVLAHMANDREMIDSFNHDIDFHSQTASRLYEVPLDVVTKDMRRMAKAINFGIIYGMSAWGLSETINVSPLEANIYINKYFDTYHHAKKFLDELVENVKEDGYTKTIFNRRRYIPEATNSNKNLRMFGERTAMNAPIQGSAADIIKIAMIKIAKRFKDEKIKSLMIAQVHDELVFDCLAEEIDKVKTIVKEEMESAVSLRVKIIAEVNYGNNWASVK